LVDINFEAKPGEVIAIVGPTGAGKTTLVSLLPRFYEAQAGSILIDDIDARKITLKSLRDQISIVLQEPLLFSGSVADNIRYGRLDASMDEIIEAAKEANAHDFIMALPNQYDTELGERGAQLSGGERQRICVARAFLKDAPILILDEPTSAIDSKTEAVILDALDRLMVGRTTFMIAHRLSTLRRTDKILVLDHGRLVELGTHDQLMSQGRLYRQLYEMQTHRNGRKLDSSETVASPREVTMTVPEKKTIVLLGMITKMPVAGNIWLVAQYIEGFSRLGYDVYYVEAHGITPAGMLVRGPEDDSAQQAAAFISRIMHRFGWDDRWAYHALHTDGKVYGMSEFQLRELYARADLIINLHGGTKPLPEHCAGGKLIYLGTDPVATEIELAENRQETIDFMAQHSAWFTWGLNQGQADCLVPVSERFPMITTRPPVVMDFWKHSEKATGRPFTTIGNWRQLHRELQYKGEVYHWSKHFEFLKFIDLPRRTSQVFELALSRSSLNEQDRQDLEANGWLVKDALSLSTDLDAYRQYIAKSRAEFTVAKDQNVRLRSGWFSERSAQYLASGRPVITQDTGFGGVLPTDCGLFRFSTMDEILGAVEAINGDYRKNCRKAKEIAKEYFSHEVVLGAILDAVGMGPQKAVPRTTKNGHVEGGIEAMRPAAAADSVKEPAAPARNLSISLDGQDGMVLLASCLGDDTGGGLFAFAGAEIEELDRLSSTGLTVFGDRLARLLWCPSDMGAMGELLIYDAHGVAHYHRLSGVSGAHDIAWDGRNFVVVSTGNNSLVRFSPAGELVSQWHAPGDGDVWHLNSLYFKDGDLHAAAFGRFREEREWNKHKNDGSGFVANLATGFDALTGLCCPHHPRQVDGMWIICNSACGELLQINPESSEVTRRLELGGWTRGLAYSDDYIFVGISAHRHDPTQKRSASIAIIDRHTWALLDQVALPCREIYDLILAPSALVDGIRKGLRTNPLRVAEQDQYGLFTRLGMQPLRAWVNGDPLPPEACRVRIEAQVPAELPAAALVELSCVVENLGTGFFASAQPHPVCLSYKWIDARSGSRIEGMEGLRAVLPRTLAPHFPQPCKCLVQTPAAEGEFVIRLTLVQEHVVWFDDVSLGNACDRLVQIIRPEGAQSALQPDEPAGAVVE
jgi:ABC-type multidrug transport system ATPase subunit